MNICNAFISIKYPSKFPAAYFQGQAWPKLFWFWLAGSVRTYSCQERKVTGLEILGPFLLFFLLDNYFLPFGHLLHSFVPFDDQHHPRPRCCPFVFKHHKKQTADLVELWMRSNYCVIQWLCIWHTCTTHLDLDSHFNAFQFQFKPSKLFIVISCFICKVKTLLVPCCTVDKGTHFVYVPLFVYKSNVWI